MIRKAVSVPLGSMVGSGSSGTVIRIVERLHVRTALTYKNYLFAGSDAGGERAAIAYTILGSCHLAGVDPREYLADILPRLTGRVRLMDLPARLPARFAAQRAATAAGAAAAATVAAAQD